MSTRISPSLRFAIYDGIAFALMAGLGETFLSAYAIFLHAEPTQLALLGALPAIIPAFSQIAGVRLMNLIPSRRRLVMSASALQGISWLPLALLGIVVGGGAHAPNLLLFFAAIYFFFGGLSAPAWNSLIGDLVPKEGRGAYFGLRNRKMAYATLTALLVAGPLLSVFQKAGYSAAGFTVLFLMAAACRLVSAYWVTRYDDPDALESHDAYFSFFEFLRRTPFSNFTKFVWFVSFINFGLSICGPFFSLFVLKELQFSYAQFTVLSGCMIAAQILTLQHWGSLSDRFGNKAILFVAAPGVTCLPLLWIISNSFIWLIFIHLCSGFLWAGFNLSAANFLFDAVSPPKRARCAAYQSILNGIAILSGSLIGSYFLSHPIEPIHAVFTDLGHRLDFYVLFLASAIVRAVVVLYFWKLIKEVREVESIEHKELIFKVIQVRALTGLLFGFDSRRRKNTLKEPKS